MNGSGQIQFASGAAYVGEFVNNCFFGKGQYMWPNGSNFDGQFANNRFLLLFLILFYQLTNFYLRDVYVSMVFAMSTWLGDWMSVCYTPVLYQNG